MTVVKWIPLEIEENVALFSECKQLKELVEWFTLRVSMFLNNFQKRNPINLQCKVTENELFPEVRKIYVISLHVM